MPGPFSEVEIKRRVGKCFSDAGFHVTEIPETNVETPDLLLERNGQRFLVEIKTKEDDPEEVEERRETLARGEIADSARPFIPQNTLSRIIKKGASQLATHQESGTPLRLLWLLAVGSDPEGQYEQFRSTFYGLTNVTGPDSRSLTPCYFLKHSAFFRWRATLDGAVIATPRGAELLLNPSSTRYVELRDSEIAKMFRPHVVDPEELEHQGQAYIADCDIDRSQENDVIAYIARKYKRPLLMTFNLGSLVAYIEPPDEQ